MFTGLLCYPVPIKSAFLWPLGLEPQPTWYLSISSYQLLKQIANTDSMYVFGWRRWLVLSGPVFQQTGIQIVIYISHKRRAIFPSALCQGKKSVFFAGRAVTVFLACVTSVFNSSSLWQRVQSMLTVLQYFGIILFFLAMG